MPQENRISGTHRQVLAQLRGAVASLAGGAASPEARGLKLRIGMVALACIQEAFLVKASGGIGDDGIQWAPLKPETIAARRMGPGEKKALGVGGRRERGFLTPAENARWKKIFATRKFQMMARHGMGEAAASARAAQIAWATLKAEGAKTKLQVLGSRHVEIGRDSGRLLNSLSPGVVNPDDHPLLSEPPVVEDQILRDEPGAVVVGSNVGYASHFHAKRRLWPDGELPPAWAERIAEALKSGILEIIAAR